MLKDELKIFYIKKQIDDNIDEIRKRINIAYDYVYDSYSSIDRDELLEELEDAEYILKNIIDLIKISRII